MIKKSILLCSSALLMLTGSYAQNSVTTGGAKYTLMEEITGQWCGYCPDGAQDIEQFEPTFPRAVVASWHGYGTEPMSISGDPFTSLSYFTGYPMGCVDRTAFGGTVGKSRPWDSYMTTQNGTTAKFDVTMTCSYNATTRKITIAVKGKALSALTGKWNINAYITEDSISSSPSAYQQHSYLKTNATACNGMANWFYGLSAGSCGSGCDILPAANYSHMNVVRSVLCTGGSVFGDTAFTNPAANATFTKNYTYTIPSGSNPHFVKVIGLVQKPGPVSNTAGNAIENCIQAKVSLMTNTGVNETMPNCMMDVSLYPNPANNNLTVKGYLNEPSATSITISDAIGQTVLHNEYPAAGSLFGEILDLSKLSNGMYLMNIVNNGEKVTKTFIIRK